MDKFTSSELSKKARALSSLALSASEAGISMGLQVKNEVDIVENNIRFHAFWGVSKFYIIDNGSVDGTWDTLNELKKEFDIDLWRDEGLDHNQSENMTFLAHQARKDGFKWFIPNDADEFWTPRDLEPYHLEGKPVVRVARFNNVPVSGEDYGWLSGWWVKNGIAFDLYKPFELGEDKRNFIFAPVMHKSYVRLKGLVRIGGGNHGASSLLTRRYVWDDNISIFHLALRSRAVFVRKAQDMFESIELMKRKGRKHNFGPQAVFWAQAYEKGIIDEVYDRMFVLSPCLSCLEDLDVIKQDDLFSQALKLAGVRIEVG